ncbi:MAG TPA: ABC transporter permease [Candidatus Bathyarchaeia archaeon]|nr:ABC transporter permease [Candidatus Bathyarchaeia archaeon]
MRTKDVFSYSFSAIKLRKLRAALTTLGVIIGIASIVALLSISQGLQTTITNQLEQGLAADTLLVSVSTGGAFGGGPGGGGGGGFGGGTGSSASSGFKLYINYTDEIKSLSQDVEASFAVIQQSGYIQNGDAIRQFNGGVTGVNFSEYAGIYSTTFLAESGTIPLSPQDDVVVIGARVHDPRLNGTRFADVNDNVTLIWTNATQLPFLNQTYSARVTAVLPRVGGFGIGGPSDSGVYIPISKAQSFFGTDEASSIIVKLKNSDNATIATVSKLITDHFANQVNVISATAVLSLLTTIFSTLTLFLGGIAAISLLVAGIGIMNIMIVSLIERTREIGILKALGMKSRAVLAIFLCESVIIGLIGALVGIALGWVLANTVAVLFSGGGPFGGGGGLSITPILTPEVLLLALGFGVGVSVIFALYPAWRASKLRPVDALRYE